MALKRYCTSRTTLEPKTPESNKSVLKNSKKPLTAPLRACIRLSPRTAAHVPLAHQPRPCRRSLWRRGRGPPYLDLFSHGDHHQVLAEFQRPRIRFARRRHQILFGGGGQDSV